MFGRLSAVLRRWHWKSCIADLESSTAIDELDELIVSIIVLLLRLRTDYLTLLRGERRVVYATLLNVLGQALSASIGYGRSQSDLSAVLNDLGIGSSGSRDSM